MCDPILASFWWGGAQTALLYFTLVGVALYTFFTYRMMKSMREELGLKKQPVVSIVELRPKNKDFQFCVDNLSMVHAVVLMQVTVILGKDSRRFDTENVYSGNKVMSLQAKGVSDILAESDLSLRRYVKPEVFQRSDLCILIESWVGNYHHTKRDKLRSINLKNPIIKYRWDSEEWVQEVPPLHQGLNKSEYANLEVLKSSE